VAFNSLALYRLPGVHAGVPLRHSEVRLREPGAADPQVHVLRRPLEVGLKPACATVCPTGAISFGDRDDIGREAKRRIATAPGHVHPRDLWARRGRRHSVLHLSSVPFEQIGYITGCRRTRCRISRTAGCASRRTCSASLRVFAALTWIVHRAHARPASTTASGRRRERASGPCHRWDPDLLRAPAHVVGLVLLAIIAVGGVLTLIRYATAIASVANINNAYPWGWWVATGS
jgi:ferredoxin